MLFRLNAQCTVSILSLVLGLGETPLSPLTERPSLSSRSSQISLFFPVPEFTSGPPAASPSPPARTRGGPGLRGMATARTPSPPKKSSISTSSSWFNDNQDSGQLLVGKLAVGRSEALSGL